MKCLPYESIKDINLDGYHYQWINLNNQAQSFNDQPVARYIGSLSLAWVEDGSLNFFSRKFNKPSSLQYSELGEIEVIDFTNKDYIQNKNDPRGDGPTLEDVHPDYKELYKDVLKKCMRY